MYALQELTGSTRQELVETYQKESLDGKDVERVLGILEDSGAQAHAQRLVKKEAALAFGELKRAPLPMWAM